MSLDSVSSQQGTTAARSTRGLPPVSAWGVVHPDMVSVAGVAPILVHLARSRETFQVSGVGP